MRGHDVEAWQARLVQLGYAIAVDGRYGEASAAATRQLQADRGLLVTGCVDKTTHANGGQDRGAAGEGTPAVQDVSGGEDAGEGDDRIEAAE
ncbi:peptidoglycan-binding domain-containing protein [Nonomuraea dietziae]|uniref:peptidoglycan-binding domain-containing protein n=1 Tax=Nonomuraea dietziae TaxID=65515 RepID=UPI0033DCF60E